MGSVLSANLDLMVFSLFRNALDLNTVDSKVDYRMQKALAEGTGNGQINQRWHDRRSLVSTSEELDLHTPNGAVALVNEFGEDCAFAKVKVIMIYNRNTGAGENLTIGNAAAQQFSSFLGSATDKIVLGPKGILILVNPDAGYASAAGSTDKLKIDAGGNTVEYDIILMGVKA